MTPKNPLLIKALVGPGLDAGFWCRCSVVDASDWRRSRLPSVSQMLPRSACRGPLSSPCVWRLLYLSMSFCYWRHVWKFFFVCSRGVATAVWRRFREDCGLIFWAPWGSLWNHFLAGVFFRCPLGFTMSLPICRCGRCPFFLASWA